MNSRNEPIQDAKPRIPDAGPSTSGLDMGMAYADFDRAPAEAWAFVEEVGLSPWQALRLMTAQTAEALKVGDQVGSIAKGKVADLAAFAGDPAADIRALNTPVYVIQSGELVVGPPTAS